MKRLFRSLQTYFPFLQDVRMYSGIFFRRVFHVIRIDEWNALKLVHLTDGQIIDVGANRGQSIESIRMIFGNKEIIAFEPNQYLANKLKKLYRTSKNIQIIPVALGGESGKFNLYLPKYRGWIFDGLGSLLRDSTMSGLNSRTLMNFNNKHLSCIEMEVNVEKLDSFGLKPSVLKIDTEGFEMMALKGAKETIAKFLPVILLEDSTREIIEFLKVFGYRPFSFKDKKLHLGDTSTLNTFFLCDKHIIDANVVKRSAY